MLRFGGTGNDKCDWCGCTTGNRTSGQWWRRSKVALEISLDLGLHVFVSYVDLHFTDVDESLIGQPRSKLCANIAKNAK